MARILTDIGAGFVANASELEASQRTTQQLREALESRIIIEQPKGIIPVHQQCSIDEAFRILRDHSRRHDVGLSGGGAGCRPAGSAAGRQAAPAHWLAAVGAGCSS